MAQKYTIKLTDPHKHRTHTVAVVKEQSINDLRQLAQDCLWNWNSVCMPGAEFPRWVVIKEPIGTELPKIVASGVSE